VAFQLLPELLRQQRDDGYRSADYQALMRSVRAKTTGSSLSSPREASSQTRQSSFDAHLGTEGKIESVAFSPDCHQVLAGGRGVRGRVHGPTPGRFRSHGSGIRPLGNCSFPWTDMEDRINSVAFSRDGRLVVTMHIWNYSPYLHTCCRAD
jgi:hypothetical protein